MKLIPEQDLKRCPQKLDDFSNYLRGFDSTNEMIPVVEPIPIIDMIPPTLIPITAYFHWSMGDSDSDSKKLES